MLQLIEGGAKTGKSTRIRQDLLALADREEIPSGELLLLVPEQFSYETERAYYHALGIRRADRVQVLSFKRLSDEVFREYGGLAGETAGSRQAPCHEAGSAGLQGRAAALCAPCKASGSSGADAQGHVGIKARRHLSGDAGGGGKEGGRLLKG